MSSIGLGRIIGAPSDILALGLVQELYDRGTIKMRESPTSPMMGGISQQVNLTLAGWEQYEAEKHGKFEGNYGFIAMQFGENDLDKCVEDFVKPVVEGIGYALVDMNDIAQAGVIDNIMRVKIRASAFVIADLTHDNSGAYWEAGYAEGLDKPVIYICNKSKFEKDKTHFDTNHCTTVLWSIDDPNAFKRDLKATLQRSLNLDLQLEP